MRKMGRYQCWVDQPVLSTFYRVYTTSRFIRALVLKDLSGIAVGVIDRCRATEGSRGMAPHATPPSPWAMPCTGMCSLGRGASQWFSSRPRVAP